MLPNKLDFFFSIRPSGMPPSTIVIALSGLEARLESELCLDSEEGFLLLVARVLALDPFWLSGIWLKNCRYVPTYFSKVKH